MGKYAKLINNFFEKLVKAGVSIDDATIIRDSLNQAITDAKGASKKAEAAARGLEAEARTIFGDATAEAQRFYEGLPSDVQDGLEKASQGAQQFFDGVGAAIGGIFKPLIDGGKPLFDEESLQKLRDVFSSDESPRGDKDPLPKPEE